MEPLEADVTSVLGSVGLGAVSPLHLAFQVSLQTEKIIINEILWKYSVHSSVKILKYIMSISSFIQQSLQTNFIKF